MASDVPLILGIDLGTSSLKVALITHDSETRIEASMSKEIASNSGHGLNNFSHLCMPNEHVQDVGKIFQCLHILLSSISPLLMARVTAISVTGQMHGVMGWLSENLAFSEKSKIEKKKLDVNLAGGGCGNLITWIDRRCTKEFIDSLPTSTRSEKPCSGFGCASILWQMKNQPGEFAATPLAPNEQRDLFEKAAILRKTSVGQPSQRLIGIASIDPVCGLKELAKPRSISQSLFPPLSRPVQHAPWTCVGTIADFLVAGLSSLQRPVMSPQMAMSWGYFDLELNTWDFPALNATGYSLSHLLPEVVPCGTVVGKLSFDWEGIPAGADVFVALGDLQCSVYPFLERHGKNTDVEGGVAACNLSTSAQIAFKIPSSLASNPSPTPSPFHTLSENSESVFERLLKSKRIAVWPFFKPDDRIVVAASLNGGNVVERFVKMLRVWCHQLGCPAIESTQRAHLNQHFPHPPPTELNGFKVHLFIKSTFHVIDNAVILESYLFFCLEQSFVTGVSDCPDGS
uniref:FGGY_N domain-containing protein n=1 Tax=Mesocestoides corti TaxID=53468 RepID=A0A5K3EVA8_MESCO